MKNHTTNEMAGTASFDTLVRDAMHSLRKTLGMEVAFISEFKDGHRIFRYVDEEIDSIPIPEGASDPLEESYCQRIVDGRLPEVICDTSKLPDASCLPVTVKLSIGTYMGVPIRGQTGRVLGTFCCFGARPTETLGQNELKMMRLFADFVGKMLERQYAADRARREIKARIETTLSERQFDIVYQPIVNMAHNLTAGYEALTRFSAEPLRPPDQWFSEALEVGLQAELELAVIQQALLGLNSLPTESYLSLNVSPETILKGSLGAVLSGYPLARLVLEVTEHASVTDYTQITELLAPLRQRGLRLAVDDAGAGFASFRHILQLNPDVIKLDVSLIRGIGKDAGRQALAAALIRFAEKTGSTVVAEGVETKAELAVLRRLRVNKVQGFLLGYPCQLSKLLH